MPNLTLWRSDGYGLFIDIHDDGAEAFEVTSISCVASWSARRASGTSAEDEESFKNGSQIIRFMRPSSAFTRRMHVVGNISDIVLHAISTRPKQCFQVPANTPSTNYAIFWQTFWENYPFFRLHGIDWNAVDRKFRSQVFATTQPTELS